MKQKNCITALVLAAALLGNLTAPVASAAAAQSLGDVNGDGVIDIQDAAAILSAYANIAVGSPSGLQETQYLAADVDCSRMIDITDASLVLEYYANTAIGGSLDLPSYLLQMHGISVTDALEPDESVISLAEIPVYCGEPYVSVHGGVPYFTEFTTDVFENYSELDALGRCGTAFANICPELMPTEERGAIGSVTPSGWHLAKYDCIPDKYLYNRCHLIGFQLAGENANAKNLITGTRYLNVTGMLPFENAIADYVKQTEHHVMYRVTPMFDGDNLVASGVLMEAYSVEDNGAGITFNVFCYNVQPGVSIDYATGESVELPQDTITTTTTETMPPEIITTTTTTTTAAATAEEPFVEASAYVVNVNSKVFHRAECASVQRMSEANKLYWTGTREELLANYTPCKNCNP